MPHDIATILQPPGWNPPKGYANGVAAEGRQIFVAGQIGWTAKCELIGDGFVAQVEQALKNIVQILGEAGAKPQHLVRLNWYVTDKREYAENQKQLGDIYRAVIGKHYPAMTLLVVAGLLEPGAKVEIEATAVIPQ
ncbi:MAG: RidA family protein [Xanthobacteraceae bacterium]